MDRSTRDQDEGIDRQHKDDCRKVSESECWLTGQEN